MEAKENKEISPETWEQMSGLVADLMQRNASLAAEVAKYRDGWAMEAMQQAKQDTKKWYRTAIVLFAGFLVTNAIWIYVFQSYDYISQDGTGINSYKTEIGGDVFNGTENPREEKREESGRQEEKEEKEVRDGETAAE